MKKILNTFTDQKYINHQFQVNPAWKTVFLDKFPEYTPETYLDQAWELFESKGYSLEIVQRCSTNPNSAWYTGIRELALQRHGKTVFEIFDLNEIQMHERMLARVVRDFGVDFKTWNV